VTLVKKPESRPAPASWGLSKSGSPWEYAAAPESTDHIQIRFGELSAPATYRHSSTLCRTEAGVALVSREYWGRATWDEVAATLAHELTHAEQMLSAGYTCDCSVEREMQAFSAEMFQLQTRGRKDLLQQNFGYAYDAKGKFSQTLLWTHLRKVYSGCKLRG